MYIVVAVILVFLGLIILLGKMDPLLSGYKKAIDKSNIKFDFDKVKYIVSIMLIFLGTFFIVDYLGVLKVIPNYVLYVVLVGIIILIVWILFFRKEKK